MKLEDILKRTYRTAEAVGMLVGGLVIVWFLLAVGGVFEDTWFDIPGEEAQEQVEDEP